MGSYVGNQPPQQTPVYPAAEAVHKNYLINSDFNVNQREYVNGAVINYGIYTRDRWFSANGSASESFTFDGAGKCTLSNNDALLGQHIEITEGMKAGDELTMSWKGTASGYLGENISNGGSHFITSLEVTAGFILVFFGGASATVWEPKVEYGSSVTPWEPPDPTTELAKCQRYFQRLKHTSGNYAMAAYVQNATTARCILTYGTKRVAPSLTVSSGYTVKMSGVDAPVTAIALSNRGLDTARVDVTCSGGGMINGYGASVSSVSNSAHIDVDAEIL